MHVLMVNKNSRPSSMLVLHRDQTCKFPTYRMMMPPRWWSINKYVSKHQPKPKSSNATCSSRVLKLRQSSSYMSGNSCPCGLFYVWVHIIGDKVANIHLLEPLSTYFRAYLCIEGASPISQGKIAYLEFWWHFIWLELLGNHLVLYEGTWHSKNKHMLHI